MILASYSDRLTRVRNYVSIVGKQASKKESNNPYLYTHTGMLHCYLCFIGTTTCT